MEMLVIALVAVVAFAAVLVPLFRRLDRSADAREFDVGPAVAPDEPVAPPDVAAGDDEVELEVQRYRAAVRAGTVCRTCGQANPADALFCFECGARLPRADAKEFE